MTLEPAQGETDVDLQEARRREIRRAQVVGFERQTPINALVVMIAALCTLPILWRVVPTAWLAAWLLLQLAIGAAWLIRWAVRRRRGTVPSGSLRSIRRATAWAVTCGLLWGSTLLYMPIMPPTNRLALTIMVGAMTAGASTTMAAIPSAARGFILPAVLPAVVGFLLIGDPLHVGLGAMAALMALGALAASRVAHRQFVETVVARQEIAQLTERHQRSQAEWLQLTDTAEGFALLDGHGCLMLWNAGFARSLGIDPGELVRGRPYRELLAMATPPTAVAAGLRPRLDWIEQQLGLHRAQESSEEQQLCDGRWLRSSARPAADGAVLVTHVDITELKRAEIERASLQQQFHRAQQFQALGTLAGGVAHDFNNILAIVLGHGELIASGLPSASPLRANLERIFAACQRGAELVSQILAFSRQDRQELTPVRLDLLLEEELTLLRAALPAMVELKPRIAVAASVRGNRTQLHQVITNLCLNAGLAAGGRPGWVEIGLDAVEVDGSDPASAALLAPGRVSDSIAVDRASDGTGDIMWVGVLAAGPHVRVSVRDGGVGMPRAVLEHIFDPFFTTREIGAGAGLGLAAVRGIVSGMGGAIVVRTAPGQGSGFDLYFPRSVDPTPATAVPPVANAAIGHGRRVLFVDDEPALVEAFERQLQAMGFSVLALRDPTVALRRFREAPENWDVVITDHAMPGMTGLDLARGILARRPGVPIIMCTGFGEAIEPDAARDIGIHKVLKKPVPSARLAEAVVEALAAAPAGVR